MTFYVSGIAAQQTTQWVSGEIKKLDLTFSVPTLSIISITTDKYRYLPGDTMNFTLNISNPTASPVTFEWYIGVPQQNI